MRHAGPDMGDSRQMNQDVNACQGLLPRVGICGIWRPAPLNAGAVTSRIATREGHDPALSYQSLNQRGTNESGRPGHPDYLAHLQNATHGLTILAVLISAPIIVHFVVRESLGLTISTKATGAYDSRLCADVEAAGRERILTDVDTIARWPNRTVLVQPANPEMPANSIGKSWQAFTRTVPSSVATSVPKPP